MRACSRLHPLPPLKRRPAAAAVDVPIRTRQHSSPQRCVWFSPCRSTWTPRSRTTHWASSWCQPPSAWRSGLLMRCAPWARAAPTPPASPPSACLHSATAPACCRASLWAPPPRTATLTMRCGCEARWGERQSCGVVPALCTMMSSCCRTRHSFSSCRSCLSCPAACAGGLGIQCGQRAGPHRGPRGHSVPVWRGRVGASGREDGC